MSSVEQRARELLNFIDGPCTNKEAGQKCLGFFVQYGEQIAAALREQPEARGVVDAESLLDELESAAEDYSGRGLLWQGFRSRDERLAVVQAALTAAQQPVQEGGGEVCPRCKGAGEYEGFARHASGDPQDEYAATVQCEPCEGTGEVAAPPSAPVGVERGAWTDDDMLKPWGAESAFLRHLASDPALNLEQSAMLRHCAKRIESTAGIHLRALADMLDPAKQAGVLRDAADALAQQPAPPSAP